MNAKLYKLPLITAAGGAGTSTGAARIGCPLGRLVAVGIDYGTAPATTDVVLTATHPMSKAVFTRNNSGTDLPLTTVKELPLDPAAAALTHSADFQPVSGELVADVAQADSGSTVQVYALVEVL